MIGQLARLGMLGLASMTVAGQIIAEHRAPRRDRLPKIKRKYWSKRSGRSKKQYPLKGVRP